jgi:hypothetical protein
MRLVCYKRSWFNWGLTSNNVAEVTCAGHHDELGTTEVLVSFELADFSLVTFVHDFCVALYYYVNSIGIAYHLFSGLLISVKDLTCVLKS